MPFQTPPLEYDYNALEPHIDEATMRIHHDKHHETYVTNLNAAVSGTEFENIEITDLMKNISQVPSEIRIAVQNNGGGHANHSLFWDVIGPNAGGEPSGDLLDAINRCCGSFDGFKRAFTEAGTKRFGSGWAWLVKKANGDVDVYSTANQDSPLIQGDTPILGMDVWEHAYYLNYQNRRPEYIAAFFNIINWNKVAERFGK